MTAGKPILPFIPAYLPTCVCLLLVLYLTLFPKPLGDEEIELFEGADKVVHFIMFGGLTGTFIFDRRRTLRTLPMAGAVATAFVVTALGGVIELLQDAMDMGRGGDPADFTADLLGAFAAVGICRMLGWIKVRSAA